MIVLLSGGIDSAALLALAVSDGSEAQALFVDYGQSAARLESRSSLAISRHFGVERVAIKVGPLEFGSGELRGRNAMLLHTALFAFPRWTGPIAMGIHGGTSYRDCSPDFVRLMEESFSFHTDGQVTVATPFLNWSKSDVMNLASDMEVPISMTYSCEEADGPCHTCLSCLDRDGWFASQE